MALLDRRVSGRIEPNTKVQVNPSRRVRRVIDNPNHRVVRRRQEPELKLSIRLQLIAVQWCRTNKRYKEFMFECFSTWRSNLDEVVRSIPMANTPAKQGHIPIHGTAL